MAVTNENGALKSVGVVSPKYYKRTDPINEKQAVEYALGAVDPGQLIDEHAALTDILRASGASLIEIEPNPLQPYALNVRDAAVVIGEQLIACSMGKGVRQTEPFWLVPQLAWAANVVFIGSGSLEGGDVFVFDCACLVGLSERTDLAGMNSLASVIEFDAIPVPLKPGVLHLDTALNLIGDKLVVAPDLLADYNGFKRRPNSLNVSTVSPVTAEATWDLATNFFFLEPKRALTSATSTVGRHILESSGVEVIDVPMAQHHRIGGSVRCATLPLERVA